ncbi:MAG TPA: hypothetical protein VF720_06410 [Candidatus Eisenbacteria bacterium]
MKRHEAVDPKIDRMIAALYGELNDAERLEFEKQLANDPALRAEWEEISGTRNLLTGWELEDRVPSFVVVPAVATRPRVAMGWVDVLRERFGNWFSVGGWVVAGAAAAVLLMLAKDIRIEKTPNGIAFNYGGKAPVNHVLPTDPSGSDFGGSPRLVNDGADGGQYVTKNELDQQSAAILRMMSAYMDDYRGRRDQELGAALRSLYGNLNARQASQYEDLLGKIDANHPGERTEHEFLRPTELGMSHADSLGPLRLSPEDVEVGRNE